MWDGGILNYEGDSIPTLGNSSLKMSRKERILEITRMIKKAETNKKRINEE